MSYQRPYELPEGKNAKDPLFYEMGSSVLKNKLGITDPHKAAEEETIGFIKAQVIFTEKLSKKTKFNEKYIQDIHKTALSHIYPFAGIYRTTCVCVLRASARVSGTRVFSARSSSPCGHPRSPVPQ